MRRWDTLNERQLRLLKLVEAGEDLSEPEHRSLRHSAIAVRDRGLITISRRGGARRAEITEAGRFYLENGHHPDRPDHVEEKAESVPARRRQGSRKLPTPQSAPSAKAAPASGAARVRTAPHRTVATAERRRAQAVALVEKLVEQDGDMVILDPSEEDVARWRMIVDFAKRHNLLPENHRIEKNRFGRQFRIRLIHGTHANSKSPVDDLPRVQVPQVLRALHPVVVELRDDRGRLVMPKATRRRSLLILQGLAAEAARRGHQVRAEPVPDRYHHNYYYSYGPRDDGPRYSRRDAELKITVDGFGYIVTIQQTNPQSEDDERIERLAIELTSYQAEGRKYRWVDGKRHRVEDALGALLCEIETRATEDRQRQIDEERAKAVRKARWEEAMQVARRKAAEAHYASVLDTQVGEWQRVRRLREFRDELEQRLSNERPDDGDLTAAREWLSWINGHLGRADPIENPPAMPSPPKLKPEDLAPFLRGWSPHGPERHLNRW